MGRIFDQHRSGFNSQGQMSRPVPMEIGNIRVKLSDQERRRRIQHKSCFVCGKPNCWAKKHYNNNGKRFNNNRYAQNAKN